MVAQRFLIALVAILSGTSALADGAPAGIILFPSISVHRESNQQYGDQNGFPYDLRAGYIIANGVYFGALYTNQSVSGLYSRSETSLGNTIGYFTSNASILFSYYITSAQSESGPGTSFSRTGGTGFQVDAAMAYPLGWGINIAPMLTYKSLVFDKIENLGVISPSATVQTSLNPYIGFQYVF